MHSTRRSKQEERGGGGIEEAQKGRAGVWLVLLLHIKWSAQQDEGASGGSDLQPTAERA